jgi:hypothetical protein
MNNTDRLSKLKVHPCISHGDVSIVDRAQTEISELSARINPGTPKILLPLKPYKPDALLLQDLETLKPKCASVAWAAETVNQTIEEITNLRKENEKKP